MSATGKAEPGRALPHCGAEEPPANAAPLSFKYRSLTIHEQFARMQGAFRCSFTPWQAAV